MLSERYLDYLLIFQKLKTESVKNPETELYEMKTILHIKITSKTKEDMMNHYNFSTIQRQQMNELLRDDYAMLWSVYSELIVCISKNISFKVFTLSSLSVINIFHIALSSVLYPNY